jgi:hypothetical protein
MTPLSMKNIRGEMRKVTFPGEGHRDVATLNSLQNKPFKSVYTVRGYTSAHRCKGCRDEGCGGLGYWPPGDRRSWGEFEGVLGWFRGPGDPQTLQGRAPQRDVYQK